MQLLENGVRVFSRCRRFLTCIDLITPRLCSQSADVNQSLLQNLQVKYVKSALFDRHLAIFIFQKCYMTSSYNREEC